MRLRHFTSFALLALLAACGPPQPIYRTDIHLVPPSTEMGRMCVNNCLMAQQNCQQSCQLQEQSCRQTTAMETRNAQHQAERDYQDYVRMRTSQGKQIKKTRRDFMMEPINSCDMDACNEQCVGNFHLCYSNCGGQVIPHTNCVANCHLIPPQQPIAAPTAF